MFCSKESDGAGGNGESTRVQRSCTTVVLVLWGDKLFQIVPFQFINWFESLDISMYELLWNMNKFVQIYFLTRNSIEFILEMKCLNSSFYRHIIVSDVY